MRDSGGRRRGLEVFGGWQLMFPAGPSSHLTRVDHVLKAAAATQARVIGALVLREARTRFGRSQLGYIWSLIEPVAMIATFSLVSLAMGHFPPYGNSLPMFFALGTLAYNFYRRIAAFCTSAIDANQALLNYPIVKQIDSLLARMVLEFLTCIFVTVVVLACIIYTTSQPGPFHPEYILIAIVLLSLLGFGNGVINAVVGTVYPSWRNIEGMIARPVFMLSGVFFVADRLPPFVRPYVGWNPVLHGVELMRYGYYPEYRSPAMSVSYLFCWAMGLVLVGLAAERGLRIRATFSDARSA